MAVDTRNKRDSALLLTLPWRARLPVPDATIGNLDRLHVSFLYAGIEVGGVVSEVAFPGFHFTVAPNVFHHTVPVNLFHYTVVAGLTHYTVTRENRR